jgi:hypothetical protein
LKSVEAIDAVRSVVGVLRRKNGSPKTTLKALLLNTQ